MKKTTKPQYWSFLGKVQDGQIVSGSNKSKKHDSGAQKGLWQGEMGNINGFHGV